MRNAIAIIPARGGSKGIPRKNIRPLAGKPLLAWTVEAAQEALGRDNVYVSTEDAEIASISRQYGAKLIPRPPELAEDAATSESVLLHGLEWIEVNERQYPEILVFLQCTSPLTLPEDIRGALNLLIEEEADSVFSATKFHHFIWRRNEDGTAVGVNHDPAVRLRRQDRQPEFVENGAIYVLRVDGFRQARHRFFGRTMIYCMPAERSLEIDEPLDFSLAEEAMRQRNRSKLVALLPETVAALVLDFDGVFTDNRAIIFEDGREAVVVHRGDGMGLARLRRLGVPILVISSETNPIVQARCRKLQLTCISGAENKETALVKWAGEQGVDLKGVVYVGNDLNDLPCMHLVGCGVAVQDAHPDLIPHAKIVLSTRGGEGAIREICDLIERKIGGVLWHAQSKSETD